VTENYNRPPEGDWLGTKFLRFERRGSIAIVTVDRPERRNALTPAMYFGIRYAVSHVQSDPDLAGLLITGTGDVFIPGGDLGGDTEGGWQVPPSIGLDLLPFESIRQATKPVVCAVNGLCQGGGLMIAMLSDVTVAATHATFRAPELFRGIADTSYAQILPRQIGPALARDMLLTGRTATADEALAWGLVARLAEPEALLAEALEVVASIARTAPDARNEVKRVFDRYYGAYDRIAMQHSLSGPEPVEGFMAFKERRNPNWVASDLRTEGRL